MFKSVTIALATFLVASINAASIPLTEPDYTYFKSAIYPDYGVRFVSPSFCDPNVTQYAGYLDMGTNHYYFWFFESKENPNESPVTTFIPGGPGCTSQIGLWLDNGPCLTRDGLNIEYRNTTWTQLSNMLYIDQPTGTGFSYGDKFQKNSDESAPVFYEALQLFYEAFPKYSRLPFHLFGESFGGRMVPIFAKYIIEQNLKLEESTIKEKDSLYQKINIPLKSIALANGWLDPRSIYKSHFKLLCEDHKLGVSLSPETCQASNHFKMTVEKCNETPDDTVLCTSAAEYCAFAVDSIIIPSLGLNFQDIREKLGTKHPGEEYEVLLNDPHFQRSIGADVKLLRLCAREVQLYSFLHGDFAISTLPTIATVLDYDVPVLVYAGDQDFGADWYGQLDALSKLDFNGSESFNQLELKPWGTQHEKYGEVKGTDKLTFVRVYGAGHEAVFGQPKSTLAMFDSWINERKLVNN